MAKEKNLTNITTIAAADFLRIVTSAGASVKATAANIAKYVIETYNGSSVAGSNQSVKDALDSLNSKSQYASFDITTVLPVSDRQGRVVKFGAQITMYAQIGSLSLSTGENVIGTLTNYYPSATVMSVCGFVGTGTTTGTVVRVTISTDGTIKCYAPSALSGTLRFSASYATSNNS